MPCRNAPVKVFLVDDSAPIRIRVAAMLAARRMDIVGEASTPRAAIEGILAARPDVVVLDVGLCGGSGLQVLRAVREAAIKESFQVRVCGFHRRSMEVSLLEREGRRAQRRA